MSPGRALSTGSRASPGKPECERKCRALAWAKRGVRGQPGLEGRRREISCPRSEALPSPGCPLFGIPARLSHLSLSRDPPQQPPQAPLTPDCVPQGKLPRLLRSSPSLGGPAQHPCPALMRPRGQPPGLGEESLPCLNSSLHTPSWASPPGHQVLQASVGRACQHPTHTPSNTNPGLWRSWGLVYPSGDLFPSSPPPVSLSEGMAGDSVTVCSPGMRRGQSALASRDMAQPPRLRGCSHLMLGPRSSPRRGQEGGVFSTHYMIRP